MKQIEIKYYQDFDLFNFEGIIEIRKNETLNYPYVEVIYSEGKIVKTIAHWSNDVIFEEIYSYNLGIPTSVRKYDEGGCEIEITTLYKPGIKIRYEKCYNYATEKAYLDMISVMKLNNNILNEIKYIYADEKVQNFEVKSEVDKYLYNLYDEKVVIKRVMRNQFLEQEYTRYGISEKDIIVQTKDCYDLKGFSFFWWFNFGMLFHEIMKC